MPLGAVARVHHVQPGIDESGHAAVQKIEHDLARRRGLHIVVAHWGGGVHNHHRKTAAGGIQRQPLRQELGPLIVAHHVFERHGRVFVPDSAARNADTTHGAGIYDALDPGVPGGLQQVAGSLHVGAVEIVRVAGPQPVVGGHVEHQAATGGGAFERSGVAQVAGANFDVQPGHPAARAHQGADRTAALQQNAGHVPAKKAGCAGDQSGFHGFTSKSMPAS